MVDFKISSFAVLLSKQTKSLMLTLTRVQLTKVLILHSGSISRMNLHKNNKFRVASPLPLHHFLFCCARHICGVLIRMSFDRSDIYFLSIIGAAFSSTTNFFWSFVPFFLVTRNVLWKVSE